MFLANPHLQYIDVSRTQLSNHGVFYVVLELSLCDPLLNPTGLKQLKQLVLGPPMDCMRCAEPHQSNAGVYISSVDDALAELYFQSPALQLISLLLPADGQCDEHMTDLVDTHATMRAAWCQLNEDNHTEVKACETPRSQNPSVILRTRFAQICTCDNGSCTKMTPIHNSRRRGRAVAVEQHDQVVAFSNTCMSDDWITLDKAKMHSVLDSDSAAHVACGAVPTTADESIIDVRSQRLQRRMPGEQVAPLVLQPQQAQQAQSQITTELAVCRGHGWPGVTPRITSVVTAFNCFPHRSFAFHMRKTANMC